MNLLTFNDFQILQRRTNSRRIRKSRWQDGFLHCSRTERLSQDEHCMIDLQHEIGVQIIQQDLDFFHNSRILQRGFSSFLNCYCQYILGLNNIKLTYYWLVYLPYSSLALGGPLLFSCSPFLAIVAHDRNGLLEHRIDHLF